MCNSEEVKICSPVHTLHKQLYSMKRVAPWSYGEDYDSSSSFDTQSSSLDTANEDNVDSTKKQTKSQAFLKISKEAETCKRKSKKGIDLEALSRHGYKCGVSVLSVPPPRQADDEKLDWSWSKGQESRAKENDETYEDRLKTRAALSEGEQLANVQTQREKREISFSQKEKRKRDLGQASRGKNYVEEERLETRF